MKNIHFILLFIGLIIFSGCAQQTTMYMCPNGDQVSNPDQCTRYVCSNGTVVYDQSLCPVETQPPVQNQTPPVETNRVCSPPSLNPYCDGSTLRTNFICVNGNWQYDSEVCEWGCANGACVVPKCPPCDDGLICTEDFCSAETAYACKHVLINNENCTNGTRICSPRPLPGSYARIDVYPWGVPEIPSNLLTSGEKGIGEELNVVGARIRIDNFYYRAECPICGEAPRIVAMESPTVRITTIKEGLAINQTFENKMGDMQYFCIEGECQEESHGACIDFECTERMKFYIRELITTWNCS